MVEWLERGDVGFFYRPTVQPEHAPETSLGVQSMFLVLRPAHGPARRVRIGRKRMPTAPNERFWARVERVGSLDRVLRDQVEDEHYATKTRGERYQPGARLIAEGTYVFVRHDDHVHFVYRLHRAELDVPEELALPEAANHLVLFERNLPSSAVWTTGGTPQQLDREGTELVLVGCERARRAAGTEDQRARV
ncbi:MAG: hypothetical protein AB7O24_17800 [Kofleriaceae bacterium]